MRTPRACVNTALKMVVAERSRKLLSAIQAWINPGIDFSPG